MNFITNMQQAKNKIIRLYPQFTNSNFIEDNSGWCNYAIKVDNKYIFRFPRNQESYRVIKMEYDILKYLNNKLPNNIQVPKYIFSNLEEDGPFVGYKMIRGKFLTKKVYNNLSNERKYQLISDLKLFLETLHNININTISLDIVEPISNYKMRYKEFKKVCLKYLDEDLKQATIELFENYFKDSKMTDFKPTVIHGDLSEDHIILTEDGIGIIDFGDVRIFDVAMDYEFLYLYDKEVFDEFIKECNDENIEYRIKNFYLKIVPYYGIAYGDEIKDYEMVARKIEDLRKIL